MQIFEQRTGTFVPLTDEQVGALSEQQVKAYTEVSDAVSVLAGAEAELESAKAKVEADLTVLREVEKAAPKFNADAERVKLVKEMIASNREE